jgi:hypothetical protein
MASRRQAAAGAGAGDVLAQEHKGGESPRLPSSWFVPFPSTIAAAVRVRTFLGLLVCGAVKIFAWPP